MATHFTPPVGLLFSFGADEMLDASGGYSSILFLARILKLIAKLVRPSRYIKQSLSLFIRYVECSFFVTPLHFGEYRSPPSDTGSSTALREFVSRILI